MSHVPVAVHVNYHPDKELKVEQINRVYLEGEAVLAATTLKEGGLLDRKPPWETGDGTTPELLGRMASLASCLPLGTPALKSARCLLVSGPVSCLPTLPQSSYKTPSSTSTETTTWKRCLKGIG